MVECKNCKSTNNTKNGIKRKKQRYKCKECGYNFVIGNAHSSAQKLALKALVVMLYTLGRTSYSMLAKIFGVSNGTIHNWVVEAAKALPMPSVSDNIKAIEFDDSGSPGVSSGNGMTVWGRLSGPGMTVAFCR